MNELTQTEYDQLLAVYVETVVDGMDYESLMTFAMENIELNLRENFSTEDELFEEIVRVYDEDSLESMLESVGITR